MASPSDFNALLQNLTTADNGLRQLAEQQYESLKKSDNGTQLPHSLLYEICKPTNQAHIRKLAAVLLRRLLIEDSECVYRQMSADSQKALRVNLLAALNQERDSSLKSKICDIVGEFAGMILDPEEWPEIVPFALNSVQSPDPLSRETGLALLGMVSPYLVESLARSPVHAHTIVNIFQSSLGDDHQSSRVVLAAIRALSILLNNLLQESDLDSFHILTPAILRGLQGSAQITISDPADVVAIAYCESLIDIAETTQFFAAHTDAVFECVMNLIESAAVPVALRHMLIELLVNICTNNPKKARKLRFPSGEKGYFAARFIPMCVSLMVTVTEDPRWAQAETVEELASSASEGTADWDVGETALDRVTQALGLRATFSVMTTQLMSLFSHSSWQYQFTGLRCIGNYLEVSAGIPDRAQLSQYREEVTNTIIAFSQNMNPRVRGAAFYAATQFFVMHGKNMRESQVERLLKTVLSSATVSVNPSPRVRRNVLLSLVHLIDAVPSSVLEKHTRAILDTIVASLSEGPVIVQELCVSALISITESLRPDAVAPYYDNLMPILKQLLAYAQSHALEGLWGQGIECCARLGEVSGKVKFYPDALEMMGALVSVQKQLDENSEARKYLMRAWVRIARCLEAEFLPFLQLVLDQLLAAITQDLSAGTGDIDLDDVDQRSDIEMIETADGWKAVRTAAVEEQASACQLLVLIVERMQEHFYPYVEQSIRAIAPLVKSPHEDVRSYALVSLGEFVRATAKATAPDRASLATLAEYCLGLLVEAIAAEDVLELIMTGLQALKQVLNYLCFDWSRAVGTGLGMKEPPAPVPSTSIRTLNVDQMEAVVDCTKQILRDSLQRRAVLRAEAAVQGVVDDEDLDDERFLMGESLELHFNVSEVIGTLLRTHGDVFFPVYMQKLHESVTEMSHPHCLREDRQFSFYVISDVVEYGLSEASAGEYFQAVMPVLTDACARVPEAVVRQACAYTLGMAAELYPRAFVSHALGALHALGACVAMGEEAGVPRGNATDNAVSAVGAILEKMEMIGFDGLASAQYGTLWGQWLDYLPLRDDTDEGKKVLAQLIRLMASKHLQLLQGDQRLTKAVSVLLEVLDTDMVSDELSREIPQTLRLVGALFGPGNYHATDYVRSLVQTARSDLIPKLERALDAGYQATAFTGASSPLANAPIHDVLLRR